MSLLDSIDPEQLAGMSRQEKLKARKELLRSFLQSDKQIGMHFLDKDDDGRDELKAQFYSRLTERNPDFGRYAVVPEGKATEQRYSYGGGTASYTEEVVVPAVTAPLYDDHIEYLYDAVEKGLVATPELDQETTVFMAGLMHQRGSSRAKDLQGRAQQIAQEMGVGEKLAEVGGVTTGILKPFADIASWGAEKLGVDVSERERHHALLHAAYPDRVAYENWGQMLGLVGGSVGVYAKLAQRGLSTVVVKEGAKRRVALGALGATAGAEFALGYAYNTPTLILGGEQEPSRLLSGLEAMFLGSALNLAVDAVMPLRGMKPQQAREYLDDLDPPKWKEVRDDLQQTLEANQLKDPTATPISEGVGPAATPELKRIGEIDTRVQELAKQEEVVKARRGLSKKERSKLNVERRELVNEKVRLEYYPELTKYERMAEEARPGSVLGVTPYSALGHLPRSEIKARAMKELILRSQVGGYAAFSPNAEEHGRLNTFVLGFMLGDPRGFKGIGKWLYNPQRGKPGGYDDVVGSIGEKAARILEPLDQRILKISATTFNALRGMEMRGFASLKGNMDQTAPFVMRLRQLKKQGLVTKKDVEEMTLAVFNRNVEARDAVFKRLDPSGELASGYSKIDEMLRHLHGKAKETGMNIKYLYDYFPRSVKNYRGLMEKHGWARKSEFQKMVDKFEANSERAATHQERANIFNKMLSRGEVEPGASYTKKRKLEVLESGDLKYYNSMEDTLGSYIFDISRRIERRKFLGQAYKQAGKKPGEPRKLPRRQDDILEESIGKDVSDLVEELRKSGHVDTDKINELTRLLKVRMEGDAGPHSWVAGYRNIHYATTIGNPFSTLTQFSDISLAAVKDAGVTGSVLGRALRGKGFDYTVEDFGLSNVADDIMNRGKTGAFLDWMLKGSGFKAIDRLGKNTHLSSAYQRLRKSANASPNSAAYKKFKEEQQPRFGSDFEDLVDALRNGDKANENVRLAVFNELADIQPITLSSMPEQYIKSKNGRLMYALKSFTIKQVDFARKQILDKIVKAKTPAQVKEGMANYARYVTLFGGSMMGINTLKDFILGRDIEVKDELADAWLQTLGASRFSIYQWKDIQRSGAKRGLTTAAGKVMLPGAVVFDLIDDFIKLGSGKLESFQDITSIKDIPIGGKFAYWRLGEGKEKTRKWRVKKMAKPGGGLDLGGIGAGLDLGDF